MIERTTLTDSDLEQKAAQFQHAAGRDGLTPAQVYRTNMAMRDALVELLHYRRTYAEPETGSTT